MQRRLDDYGNDDTEDPDTIDQSLIDRATQLKETVWRQIPTEERYPVWWGQLRGRGMSPHSLNEMDYYHRSNKCDYHPDDREEPIYEQHFVEIHDHTDL